MILMTNKNYGDWLNYPQNAWWKNLFGGSSVPSYSDVFGGYNSQSLGRLNRANQNPVQPTTIAPQQTVQPPQTAITPENSPNYYASRGFLNLKVDSDLPTDQDVLNNYNEWRKNNPKAAGQDWKMQLANGVTLTEENVNNILNPYGTGRPEGVPKFVPTYVPEAVMNRNLLAMRKPNWTEAQYQQYLNQRPEYKNSLLLDLMPKSQGR